MGDYLGDWGGKRIGFIMEIEGFQEGLWNLSVGGVALPSKSSPKRKLAMQRKTFPNSLLERTSQWGFARLCRSHPLLLPERPWQAMQPMPKGILVFMFQPQACMTSHAPGLKHKNRPLSRPAAFACGERGIRTPGTVNPVRQFSKLLVSATHPSHQE